MPYDPRDPNTLGVSLTRLDYNPHALSGSTHVVEVPDFALENRASYDSTSTEWLPATLKARAERGQPVPAWAFGLFQRRQRPDLVAWCQQVNAALAQQGG